MNASEWGASADPYAMLKHVGEADRRKLRLFSCAYANTCGNLARFGEICRRRFFDAKGRYDPQVSLASVQAELLAVRAPPPGARHAVRFDGGPPLAGQGEYAYCCAVDEAEGRRLYGRYFGTSDLESDRAEARRRAAAGDLAARRTVEECEALMAALAAAPARGALWTVVSASHDFIGISGAASFQAVNRSLRKRVVEQTELLQAELVREIFGDPFASTDFDRSRLDPAIVQIARSIYDRRAYEELPILADALADAGFVPDEIVEHLSADRPHVLGCWALDAIRGKDDPRDPDDDPYYRWLGISRPRYAPILYRSGLR